MEHIYYEYKPLMMLVAGFICISLDHPAKWLAISSLVAAGLLVKYWRYKFRYDELNIKSVRSRVIY